MRAEPWKRGDRGRERAGPWRQTAQRSLALYRCLVVGRTDEFDELEAPAGQI